jgi:predicted membrane channel-forming protein YqfA (hemolysin III family)
MEVPVLSKGRILRNLTDYLPAGLSSGFLFFVFGAAILFFFLHGWTRDDLGRVVAIATSGVAVLLTAGLYNRFVVNRLARYRLALDGDILVVRGQTAAGLVEKRYPVSGVRAVLFGEPPAGMDASKLRRGKELRPGRLLVQGPGGDEEIFHSVDRAFAPEDLAAFLRELEKRGVVVGGIDL